MQLDRDSTSGNLVRGFAAGELLIGAEVFRRPVIVTIDRIIADWPVVDAAGLTLADLRPVIDLAPEVILIGTGIRQRFPPAGVTMEVLRMGIGIEVMDTAAACRTYNVLAAELRRVAAALFIA